MSYDSWKATDRTNEDLACEPDETAPFHYPRCQVCGDPHVNFGFGTCSPDCASVKNAVIPVTKKEGRK